MKIRYLQLAASLLLAVAFSSVLVERTEGLIHVVGGSDGWEIPPNRTFYAEWAKPRTFGVGDELIFPYRPGAHNVIEVGKEDYDKCGHEHIINQFSKGPTRFKLEHKGDYYFYSGIGTHCEDGQKLHIQVGDGPGSDGKFPLAPRVRRALLGVGAATVPAPAANAPESAGSAGGGEAAGGGSGGEPAASAASRSGSLVSFCALGVVSSWLLFV